MPYTECIKCRKRIYVSNKGSFRFRATCGTCKRRRHDGS